MRYGELLYADGTLNPMTSVCGQIKNREVPEGSLAPKTAWQEDVYTLRGGDPEVYEPHFTWHGFRYVEVTGYPGEPPADAIEGIVISSDVESAGTFACSNEMFTKLQDVVRWTLRSNLSSVQTDCPHREKFGYGGDIVASSEMAMLNYDMGRFYAKTVRDYADAQRENGAFTETAPYVGISDGGVDAEAAPPGWGVAHPLLVRQLYQYYGDRRLLEEQYPNTKRWVDLLEQHAVDGILDYGISDHESLDEKPRALTGTVFYYQSAAWVAELAEILGLTQDAEHYRALASSIQDAFNRHFLKENGVYDSGTQACQAAALHHRLFPQETQTLVMDRLHDAIVAADSHVRTGIFGTRWMLIGLHEQGRDDLAYAIVNQKTFPGWGHMLENGATTLWEHWEFSDNTFSHNHPMFGSVSEWFFKGLGGIAPAPDAVAFNTVEIAPSIVDDLTWAEASYNSVRGTIRSAWKRGGEGIEFNVEVPPNVRAHLKLPAPAQAIAESGTALAGVKGVLGVVEEGVTTSIEVGSGRYTFTAKR
jgi:alpha-L-rhamnosidase